MNITLEIIKTDAKRIARAVMRDESGAVVNVMESRNEAMLRESVEWGFPGSFYEEPIIHDRRTK